MTKAEFEPVGLTAKPISCSSSCLPGSKPEPLSVAWPLLLWLQSLVSPLDKVGRLSVTTRIATTSENQAASAMMNGTTISLVQEQKKKSAPNLMLLLPEPLLMMNDDT